MVEHSRIQAKLADAINRSGLTQTEIAKRIGVCQQAVSQYAKGERMPALTTFATLCVVLDLDANDILCVSD